MAARLEYKNGSLLEKAENIAKRIEEANQKASEILAKNEATLSKIMLSGLAGFSTKPFPENVIFFKSLPTL